VEVHEVREGRRPKVDANIVTAPNGESVLLVPGFPDKPLLPAVMVDNGGNPIGAVSQGNGTSAVLAVQLGAPVQLLYSEPPVTRTSDGNAGGLTSNPETQAMTGLFLGVNVTGVTTPGTLIVSLQQQDANGIWQTIGVTNGITAVGAACLSVGGSFTSPAMLNGGPYRIAWTLGGGTFTFQLSLQGR
jgi:hypothetical protein